MRSPTPEQAQVIHSWGQGMAVQAGAGSGKTTTLVAKCKELLARNPEARFAAVSFTEKSAGDLRAKLAEALAESGGLSRHWVMTIHGLCGAVIREYPRESGYEGEEAMLSEVEAQALWQETLDGILLGELGPAETEALRRLLAREGRDEVFGLLKRVRELHGFGALERLEAAAATDAPGGPADEDARALATLSRYALDRYARHKRRRGGIDFNDLEAGAERALENEGVRHAFQRRFDLILVDEFQDTNPVQARILSRLVRPDFSNLCIVGDPKQSIYRFRDADVSVFEDFCSRMPVQVALTWNFRSRPGILDFTNRVCEPAFEASEMRYQALVPKRERGEFEPVVRLDAEDPRTLVDFVRAEVARGVRLESMALLLRRIRGANEKWLKALTAGGIPLALGSGGFFWEDPRVRELVAFLKWWDQPAQALSGAIFLRAPWVGIDDRELDRWIKSDPTWMTPFLASSHPMALALRDSRGSALRPGELLLKLLVDDVVEEELGSALLGLWHRVEELSSRGYAFHEVVAELDLALKQGRRERDVPPPRNLGQLQVLTLHGSKGLEFQHVILLDFGKKGRKPHAPLLFWDRARGAALMPRDADGERDSKSPIETEWRANEEAKELAESKRVFYVALTRAQERLILVCPRLEEKAEQEIAEKGTELLKSDYWRGWIEVAGGAVPRAEAPAPALEAIRGPEPDLPGISPPKGAQTRNLDSTRFRAIRPRHSVTEWVVLSRCPRAYEWTYLRPPPGLPASSRSIHSGWTQAAGAPGTPGTDDASELPTRELGTRVHAALEFGNWDELRALEAEAGAERFVAEPVVKWAEASRHMRGAEPGNRQVWTELAFEVPIATGDGAAVLVGSIDRLCREGDRLSIVDFKVTEKEKSAAELARAYRIQLELYAEALQRLDPTARVGEGVLVQISGGRVTESAVPLEGVDAESLARQASEIVAGAAGRPTPGEPCQVCDFRKVCDVARKNT